MFAPTFGHHDIPPMAQQMSKKWLRLNYKQYCMSFRRSGDMALMSSLTLDKTMPTVADLLASPLAKYITLAANDCGSSGTAEELIVSYVHPLFLKAHSAASKADNPSWQEATRGKFADKYWEAMKQEIATLKNIELGPWLTVMTPMEHHIMLYPALGHSSANNIQMGRLRSSKHISVQEAINNSKGLTSLRPMPQLSNGPPYG
jgi:hypothetical protein